MIFEDLRNLYLKKKAQLGAETYKHISKLLKEAKEIHKQDWRHCKKQILGQFVT